MADFFDELSQEESPGGDFFGELERESGNEFSAKMQLVKSKSPEQAAKNYKVSDETGLPAEYIERNPDAVTKPYDYEALRKKAPLLANMLQEKRNAEVAQEELDNLSWWEEAARETKNIAKLGPAAFYSVGSAGYAILSSAQSALEMIPKAPVAAVAKAQDLLGYDEAAKRSWNYVDSLSTSSKMLLSIAQGQAELSKSYTAKPEETRIHPAVLGGIQSAITNIPAIAASALTKNPNVGLSLMGGVSFGGSYIEGKERGLNDFEAMVYGTSNAFAEVVTEKIPLMNLLGDIEKNTGFTKMLGKQMLAEGVTEQVATVWQDANAWAMLNPDKTLQEFMGERGDAAYNTLISTIVATGLQTSVVAGLNKIGSDQEIIEQIAEKANESKYRELDKVNFETFLQEVSEEYGSIDHLYIDAESAREAIGNMDEQDAAYALISGQLEEAEALNGDIVIPVGEFASTVVTSNNYQFLKDSIRVTPDADAVTINSFERIQEAYQSIDKKDESKRIFEEVRDQLIDTGKLTPEQAKLSAEIIPAFLGANPERMGVTVEEAYEMMGLKVAGPRTGHMLLKTIKALKAGKETKKTKDLSALLESKGIDAAQDANEISKQLADPQEEMGDQAIVGVIDSLKSGEVTEQTQELADLLESQGIDSTQDTNEIVKQLIGLKEFKQKPTSEEVVKSDPLVESTEWRKATVTATLDDGTTQDINAGEAYDIINKRKENALNILECINANT
jgi:hypothetical protein